MLRGCVCFFSSFLICFIAWFSTSVQTYFAWWVHWGILPSALSTAKDIFFFSGNTVRFLIKIKDYCWPSHFCCIYIYICVYINALMISTALRLHQSQHRIRKAKAALFSLRSDWTKYGLQQPLPQQNDVCWPSASYLAQNHQTCQSKSKNIIQILQFCTCLQPSLMESCNGACCCKTHLARRQMEPKHLAPLSCPSAGCTKGALKVLRFLFNAIHTVFTCLVL